LSANPALILKDPEIKKYFLSILQSKLSDNDKYEQFINFFELESQVKGELLSAYGEQLLTVKSEKIEEMVSAAGQTIGIWKPEAILRETQNSIRRALQRLKNSQHRDGGWGFEVEVSHPWGTAYAVLCLNAAQEVGDFNIEGSVNLDKGSKWLKEHSDKWSLEKIDDDGSRSVYDVSIVVGACYETGETGFPSLDDCWRKLLESQNNDGGWDARFWPENYLGPTRVFSDVGATSMALHALATVKKYTQPSHLPLNLNQIFLNGLQWFIQTQNEDGSWNNSTATAQSRQLQGDPSITKTCDAIKGILIAKNSVSELDEQTTATGNQALDKAVSWLLSQETPLYDREGNIAGWGWGPETIGDRRVADLENTWLTLETLVQIESPSISLPLLTANAHWLMKQQHTVDGIEDGKWEPQGHTARIALSLIEYYNKIKASPLFEKAPDRQSATSNSTR